MAHSDWTDTSLGRLISLEYGAGLREPQRTGGGYPVFGSNGEVGRHSSYLIGGPGIIVGRKGSVGEVTWSDSAFWPIDTTYYVRAAEDCDLRWCFWMLQSLELGRLDSSTGVPGLNRNDAYGMWVKKPPFPEQRAIAKVLDAADEAIGKTETLVAKLKAIKQSLLHDLLTRGLDDNGELRDPEKHPEQFRDSVLGRIPKEWEIALVGDLFEVQLGKMLSSASTRGRFPYPYLANRNVQWDRVQVTGLDLMDFVEQERQKFSLRYGDLLVCEGGEVGRTAIWYEEIPNCYYQKAIHRLRPSKSIVTPEFFLLFMRVVTASRFILNYTSQTSIAHLTREKFSRMPVFLPPLPEQKAITNVMAGQEGRIRDELDYLQKLKCVKAGLVQDLLTGRVRVGGQEGKV